MICNFDNLSKHFLFNHEIGTLNPQASLYSYYLNSMGITPWKLRRSHIVEKFIYGYQLTLNVDQNKTLLGFLFADSVADKDQELVNEEKLLHAICQALTPQWQGKRFDLNGYLDRREQPVDFLILLGKEVSRLSNQIPHNLTVTLQYTLSQLLKQPDLKAEVWRALQPVFSSRRLGV